MRMRQSRRVRRSSLTRMIAPLSSLHVTSAWPSFHNCVFPTVRPRSVAAARAAETASPYGVISAVSSFPDLYTSRPVDTADAVTPPIVPSVASGMAAHPPMPARQSVAISNEKALKRTSGMRR